MVDAYHLRGTTRCSYVGQFCGQFVLSLLVTLAVAGLSYCQTDSVTVSGVITDLSGAVVAGVEIRVTNTDTNVTWNGISNGSGVYLVTGLKPGRYRIHVGKEGFKGIDLTDLILNVQDSVSRNFTLQVGSTSETVSVEGNALQINTLDAAVSTVVDRQFAENLPLNGRSFQSLIELTPGVVLTVSNSSDSGQFSVNGQRASANYWMVDGVSANIGVSALASPGNGIGGALGSFSAQGGTNSLVSVDALQEFRIQTSTYAPEFGRTPGGQISIVTRSGTNQFHGTLFDYLRNDVLDANDWFADSKGLKKPEERQNDFGGTFSGPIVKDKSFFFFSYEGLRLRLPQTALTSVPCDSSCTVFGNARTMAVAAMQPFLNAYPLPNGPELFTPCTPSVNGCPASGQQPNGAAQFNASYSNPATLDAYSIRIDHKLGAKINLFGRYNYSPSELDERGAIGANALSSLFVATINTQTATAGTTWAISPESVNDLRFNYSRVAAHTDYRLDNFGGAVPLASLPFPNSFSAQNSGFTLGISGLAQRLINAGDNGGTLQRQINVIDSLSRQWGSHSLKFGVDFRRLSPRPDAGVYLQFVSFSNVASAESGSLASSTVGFNRDATLLFRNLGLYAEDTWRVRPRFTLTYGLRWDVDFAPSSIDGPNMVAVTGFNLSNFSQLALAPDGTPPFSTTYGNVAPRVGLAYQVRQRQNWQTVLRGGFGVFYDLVTSEVGNVVPPFNYPFGALNSQAGGTFPLDANTAAPPAISPPSATNGQSLFALDPHMRLPYTLQWNVAVEQALGNQQTVSASYIGSVGRRLIQSEYVLFPNPNLFAAYLVSNASTSDYDALQLQFQRRLLHGLQALASYTWAHSIDTGSAGSATGNLANGLVAGSNANANRGPSDFDVRNAFSAAVTYDIPSLKINTLIKATLGGWSVQNIIHANSAPPVDLFDGSLFPLLAFSFANVRPDVVPGQPFYLHGSQFPGGKAFNPEAFMDPPIDPNTGLPLRQGNLPRNSLRGFGATQWDFAVHRDFPIREALKLQFRAEMFNVLNHPNFGPPVGDISIKTQFGQSTQILGQSLSGQNLGGGAFNPLYQVGGPRSVQFALKLIF